ncbi:MAG: dienelactone hydrolase family protein [Flavobacterium sp.]|nr:dienelactone hydrolase family protein [Pedobacter sp.]
MDNTVAGFKVIRTVDSSRIYKPNAAEKDYLRYRPLDIDLWYPAIKSDTNSIVLMRDLFGLFENRANYYTASNAGKGLSQQIAKYFCDYLKCSDTTKVLNYKTESIDNAKPKSGKFPLIIYLASYNGMGYENFKLFEELAKKGFVVASISSIGRYPGDMTMKKEDLMEQVNDALSTLKKLKQYSTIDFTKIGLVGYSWGGLSASVVAARLPAAACIVSLDGSEFHHYGKEQEENKDFDEIRFSPEFKNMRISVPYLRLESSPLINTVKYDSVYNFAEKIFSEKEIIKIDSAQHEDFGCLKSVVNESGKCKNNIHYKTISKLTISFLEKYLMDKE